jgi:hypothetical protein
VPPWPLAAYSVSALWPQVRDAWPKSYEAALLQDVERADRGELTLEQRDALANKLTDFAMTLLWRSHELANMATRIRTGSDR